MINRNHDFFRMSKAVAEDFLQSAVIVDDYLEEKYSDNDASLQEPPTRPPIGKQEVKSSEPTPAEPVLAAAQVPDDGRYYLDVKVVIDAFARKRIVCSIIRPDKKDRDSLPQLMRNLADCADILVFDWSLHDDNGDKVLEMLVDILRSEGDQQSARLRLLVVYTGDPKVGRIPKRVKSHLDTALKISLHEEQGGYAMTHEGTRIVVLAKPERDKIPPESHDRIVAFEDLPERLIDEFTEMTSGLVSNVALASFGAMRRNTSKLLRQFNRGLDPAFLAHRFMLENPIEAEGHLVGLISQELHDILEEARVGNAASIAAIEARLTAGDFSELKLDGVIIDLAKTMAILKDGFEVAELPDQSKSKKDKLRKGLHKVQLSKHFVLSDLENPVPDEGFAHLTTMRSQYEQVKPMLTQGTIVKVADNDGGSDYLVCVQARCDSVRIESVRAYPFLPLKTTSPDGDANFDVILKEGKEYKRLLLGENPKPYELRLVRFSATEQKIVRAKRLDNCDPNYYFTDEGGLTYQWMGEFRFAHAQRLSNRFGAALSRVGVDESEWLRLWAKPSRRV